jgi:ubiquitin-conjugating enzyme E2 D/E
MSKAKLDKRITKELKKLDAMMLNVNGTYKTLCTEPYIFLIEFDGPDDCLYANYRHMIKIRIPDNYPFNPPKAKLCRYMYHCNVNKKGEICMDTLKNNWMPSLTIAKIIQGLISLLRNPNPNDPLDTSVSRIMMNNEEEYIKNVEQYAVNPVFIHDDDLEDYELCKCDDCVVVVNEEDEEDMEIVMEDEEESDEEDDMEIVMEEHEELDDICEYYDNEEDSEYDSDSSDDDRGEMMKRVYATMNMYNILANEYSDEEKDDVEVIEEDKDVEDIEDIEENEDIEDDDEIIEIAPPENELLVYDPVLPDGSYDPNFVIHMMNIADGVRCDHACHQCEMDAIANGR